MKLLRLLSLQLMARSDEACKMHEDSPIIMLTHNTWADREFSILLRLRMQITQV